MRKLVRLTLSIGLHEIHEAVDGAAGLDAVSRLSPDVVVLDVMMPVVGGVAVCKAIKADPQHAATRVILLSARAQQEDIEAGMSAGADAYITKPFKPTELLELVSKMS